MSEVLKIESVNFRRGGNSIINDLSLSVYTGEHWAILGPNGGGKTTLAGIISGRLFPTSGSVQILDTELGEVALTELHERVGFASSQIAKRLDPRTTAIEAVLSAAYGSIAPNHQSLEEQDYERGRALLAAFDVAHLADRMISTLSDGEAQRVMLARSLMCDPEILLLDEPAAGLDMGAREELMRALSELAGHKSSPALILITHHVEEIPTNFTHAALLKGGHIYMSGAIEEVLTGANLSEVFGVKLSVNQIAGRWAAYAER